MGDYENSFPKPIRKLMYLKYDISYYFRKINIFKATSKYKNHKKNNDNITVKLHLEAGEIDQTIQKELYIDDFLTTRDIVYILLGESDFSKSKFRGDGMQVYVVKDNDNIFPIFDYPFCDFVKNQSLNVVEFNVLLGGYGDGAYLNDSIKFEIRENEKNHIDRPHIHIKKKGKGAVSISLLKDRKVLAGDMNIFTKKERKEIVKLLDKNTKAFKDYYMELQSGAVPQPIYFIFDGKQCGLRVNQKI